jgi:predicted aspartyl protease
MIGFKNIGRSALFCVLLFLCITPKLQADSYREFGAYPLERDTYGRVMAGVRVNGRGPFPFIIDTGASRSVFYRSLTADLEIQAIPNRSRNIVTANGYRRVLIYPVNDIYALGRTLSLEDTVALPDIANSAAKGLIGVDLLAARTLKISSSTMLAEILDSAASLSAMGWQYQQGRPVAYGSLALELEIGGVTIPVVVDTGASDTVINKVGAETLLRAASGVKSEKATAVVARGRTIARERLLVPEFSIAGRDLIETQIYVADVPIFTLLGARQVPAIILGMNVLSQQDFAVDLENWRLYLAPAE